MQKLEDLKVFMRVAELASFTQAADSLGLPKASVSSAVSRLEEALGARLLQRTTRKVQMTQDGSSFYERSKDLLADAEEIENMFRTKGTEITGRLRVDMPSSLARDVIIPKLPKFMEKHPKLEIELSSTDRRVDVIREGFDCVIRVGNLVDSELISKTLGSYSVVNCVSPSYIKKHGQPRKLEDLAHHKLVSYAVTLGAKPDGFEYYDGKTYKMLKMPSAITVNSIDGYQSACLAGLGIIQAPRIGLQKHLSSGALIEILPKLRAEPMPVSLIFPHRRNLALRVRLFMDWAEEVMKDYVQ